MFVDEAASEEQADKLVQVFSGQLGGPMAGLTPLIGQMLGVERVPIVVEDDGGGTASASATGSTSRSRTSSRSDQTGEPVRFQGMFHPVASDLTMAEAKRSNISAFGIEYEGKTGLSKSEFSWAA